MRPPDEEADDELTRAYRRRGDAVAGAPAAATRSAILAEARAATLRRTPAANHELFAWRAVAGVAVFGIAVLLWRQAGPIPTPVAALPTSVPTPPPAPPPVSAPTPAPAAASVPAPPSASAPFALNRSIASKAEPAARAEIAADQAAPAGAREAAAERSQYAAPAAPLAQRADAPQPPTVWLIQDAQGSVLRQGSLDASETLATVAQRVAREFPERRLASWQITPVIDSRGGPLSVAIARLH